MGRSPGEPCHAKGHHRDSYACWRHEVQLLTAGLLREVQVAGQQSGDGAAVVFDEAGEAVAELPPRGTVGLAREVPRLTGRPKSIRLGTLAEAASR